MTAKIALAVLMLVAPNSLAQADYGRSSDSPGLWLGISSISSDFDGLSVSASIPTRWATLSAAMGRGIDSDDDFGDYWQVSLMRAFSGGSGYYNVQETGYLVGLFHDKYRTSDETIWGVGFVTGPISPSAMRAASPVVRAFGVYMEGGETLFGATTEYSFSGCGL